MATTDQPLTAGTAAFQFSGFRLYQIARFCIVFCTEMQSVAVGWQVYEITRRPLDLGLTGLVQFLPGILLFLVAGHITDRFDRRRLLTLCYVGFAVSSALLAVDCAEPEKLHRAGSVGPIFGVLFLVGAIRTFSMPSSRALASATCAGRAVSECSGLELQHVSVRHHSWPGDGRPSLRLLPRPSGCLRNCLSAAGLSPFLLRFALKRNGSPARASHSH